MLHFINTRPADRAAALGAYLRKAGYRVSELPLLELLPEPFDGQLQQQLGQIKQADIVVVVSPIAVELGLACLAQLNIQVAKLSCQWVAVGQGTAEVLRHAGIEAVVPQLETSEGMLALDIFEHCPQQLNIMFWRGHGGRQLMIQTLQSQQHHIISVNLYCRQLPKSSEQLYQTLLSQQPDVLLISSGASWQNWLDLGQKYQVLMPAYILVLGERVYQMIKDSLAKHLNITVILLEDLQPARILSTLQHLENCR